MPVHAGACQGKRSPGEDAWEDELSERQTLGWRAVFAAGLHGKGSRNIENMLVRGHGALVFFMFRGLIQGR